MKFFMKKKHLNHINKDDQNIDLNASARASWDEYVGQEKIKSRPEKRSLRRRSGATSRPIIFLFSGPAGLGKTTLAYLVARELGGMVKHHVRVRHWKKPGDLAAILTNLSPGEILFH